MSKQEKIQALVSSMLGGQEPTFTPLTSEKTDLIRGLNFYANGYTHEDSKRYALQWAKKNLPELYPVLKRVKDWRFNNYGFVLRMSGRGFQLDEIQFNKIKAELRLIAKTADADEPAVKKAVKPVADRINKAMDTFNGALDTIVSGHRNDPILLGVDKRELKEVQAYANATWREYAEYPDDYRKETSSSVKKFLKDTLSYLDDILKTVKREGTKTVRKREKVPSKIVKDVKFLSAYPELGMNGLRPEKLVGAKTAILYNVKYRTAIVLKATEEGFSAKGTTIKNIDLEKSIQKRVRKPEELQKALSERSLTQMVKWVSDLKTVRQEPTGRMNEETIILKVGG